MPIMNGYEATHYIKSTEQGKNTPIIALTTSMFEADKAISLEAGCDEFVVKPFQPETLFAVMHEHIGVQYIYTEIIEDTAPLPPQKTLTANALSHLPPHLLTELEEATLQTNMLYINQIIEDIQKHDPLVAQGLTHLADNFEYKHILKLIRAQS